MGKVTGETLVIEVGMEGTRRALDVSVQGGHASPAACHSSLRGVTKKWGTEAELWLPLIAI